MPQNVRNKIKSLAKEAGFSGANILSVEDFKKYNIIDLRVSGKIIVE